MFFGYTMEIKNSGLHKFNGSVSQSRKWNIILSPTKVIVQITDDIRHDKPSSITKPCYLRICKESISTIDNGLCFFIGFSISCQRPKWLYYVKINIMLFFHLLFHFQNKIFFELSVIIPSFIVHSLLEAFRIGFCQ